MIKSYLAAAVVVAYLCLIAALALVAGCGSEDGEGGSARETGAASPSVAGGTAKVAPRPERVTRILVKLVDRHDSSPIRSARLTLMVQADRSPESVSVREIWTDSTGVAEEKLEDAYRAAVMSEFCARPTEISLSGEETAVTLEVATSHTVSGRVVATDAGGKVAVPLEGATVLIYAQRRAGSGTAMLPLLASAVGGFEEFKKRYFHDLAAECRTDADGRFECSVSGLQRLMATAHAEGFVSGDWRIVSLEQADEEGDGGETVRFSQVEIALRRIATLAIRFLDQRGRAVRGQEVRIMESPFSIHLRQFREQVTVPFSAAATTDGEGRARFTVPAGIEVVVNSRTPESFVPLFEDDGGTPDLARAQPLEAVAAAAGETRSLIAMPQGNVRVECTVADVDGAPVEGAVIMVPRGRASTDADGRAALIAPAHKARGGQYRVSREGYRTAEGTLPPIADDGGRVIQLAVTLENADPLLFDAGSRAQKVWIWEVDQGSRSGHVTTGGDDLPSDEFLLAPKRKTPEGWLFDTSKGGVVGMVQTGPFSFNPISSSSPSRPMVFDLPEPPEGTTLAGTIVIPDGIRPQSVSVTIMRNDIPEARRFDPLGKRGPNVGWLSTSAIPSASADGDRWTFRFENVVLGRYALGASLIEWGQRTDLYEEIAVDSAVSLIAVTLEPKPGLGCLELVVRDGDGQPVPDVDCLLLDPVDAPIAASTAMGTHFITDANGVIVMEEMIPGRYGFVVSGRALAGAPINGRVLIEPAKQSKVVVSLD